MYEANRLLTTRDAARLFSSKRIAEIASGDFSYLLEIAALYRDSLKDSFTVAEVIDNAYAEISKNYRSEYFYKNTVAERLLLGRHSVNTATVLPEFRVGRSKADCVILNGSSSCYEIKSDFDNLDRLPEQLSFYRKIFDKTYVVVGKVHIDKVQSLCRDDIGIIELTPKKSLRVIREAETSKDPVDIPVLMRSLRVNEYKEIASKVSSASIDYPNTEIFSVCEKILKSSRSEDVREAFCSTLKQSRKVEKNYVLSLPRSLLMAGIGFKLRTDQRRGLVENLNKIFSKDAICTTRFYEANNLS
ncbi:sce7726 family protein [Pseudomonas sp. SG20056]|uniref:sce7726 family protein n=1 Tax=Pseudomonas sp. SG20056 TaxID=3074146 RepID=UPI00287FE270|nr:sce7726 family protein [Pseudomonas sp. SG20056]WNF45172.1 sce7726 family protein [Pseudomonas sp. SG20056]